MLTQIPVPKDISKLAKPLESLQKLHQQISQDTEAIPAKEKAICDLIKKLTDEGKEGTDYDSHKLGDESIFKIINGKRIIKNANVVGNIPVYGGGDITFYTNKHNLSGINCLISKYGNCEKGKCVRVIKGDIYLNDNGLTVKSIIDSINNHYLSYYLLILNDDIFNCKRGSAQLGFDSIAFCNLTIKVLKPKIMSKYKLQELFDEVDNLKTQLEENKIKYQNQMDQLFAKFKNSDDKHQQTNPPAQQVESDDESEQEQLDEESESESDDEEPVEMEIKGKQYIRLGTNVYVKTKKGNPGELYGTWNASTNKVKKVTPPKEIEV